MSRWWTDASRAAQMIGNAVRTMVRPRTVMLRSGLDGDVEKMLAEFESWCAAHSGAFCEVALSSVLLRICVAPPEAGALTVQELRDYAVRQFEHYFGGARDHGEGDTWIIAASRDARAPLACAVERALVERLVEVSRAHRVRVRRVRPWWTQAIAKAARKEGVVAAVEPDAAIFFQNKGGRITRAWTDLRTGATPQEEDGIRWRSASGELRVIKLWTGGQSMPLVCDASSVGRVIRGRGRCEVLDAQVVRSEEYLPNPGARPA